MQKQLSQLSNRIQPAIKAARRYATFLFVITFLGIYMYLVQFIGTIIQDDGPLVTSENQIQPVQRLKIDEQALRQINELEAQNIQVQSLFDEARRNPFTE